MKIVPQQLKVLNVYVNILSTVAEDFRFRYWNGRKVLNARAHYVHINTTVPLQSLEHWPSARRRAVLHVTLTFNRQHTLLSFRLRTRLRHLQDRPLTEISTGPTARTPQLARIRCEFASLRRKDEYWGIFTSTNGNVQVAGQVCSARAGWTSFTE